MIFKQPIQLDKKKDYEIALINLETYYSFSNIDRSNNCFSYSPGVNTPWFGIVSHEGSYHVEDINEFIQREVRKNNHYDQTSDKVYFEISGNTNTLKSEMINKNNCEVDFTRYNSTNSLLGFHSKLYTSGFNECENMVNILTINCILINSYVNGSTQPTIYSFFPNDSPGYEIIERPYNLLYLQITAEYIYSITLWLTVQKGNELNLRRENLSMRLYVREIYKIS